MASYFDTIIADGPINYWRLGESSGNAIDEMSEHNLVWSGTPTYGVTGSLVGDSDTAMTFDGSTEFASKTVANYRSSDSQGSIEFLLKPFESIGNSRIVFSSRDAESFFDFISFGVTGTTHRLMVQQQVDYVDTAITSTGSLSLNVWNHCVITSDGTAYKIYIDGVEQSIIIAAGSNNGNWFADKINLDLINIGTF